MVSSNIIKEVVKIILKYAKPSRVYSFGSFAAGEANQSSDIDIAFDDPKFKDEHLIRQEIEKLPTLVKIDVKNIAFAEPRFKDRVISTGRIIYSVDKQTRAEDGLYNFSRALDKLVEAIELKSHLYSLGFSNIYLDLIVKRFEFTFEMSWKAIKRYLNSVGIESLNPRSCFQEAYAQGLIKDESVWLEMIEQRNLSSHIYNESEISPIIQSVERYKTAFVGLKQELEERING